MFNKILVAVDRSERSQTVFETALSIATATNSTLMILHVLSDSEADYPDFPDFFYYPMLDDRSVQTYQHQWERYQQAGIDLLQTLTNQATSVGVPTEFTQLSGNPGRNICELAESWDADLVVVGSRGLSGVREMLLGSVSNYVMHHARRSVLIVRNFVTHQLEEPASHTSNTVANS